MARGLKGLGGPSDEVRQEPAPFPGSARSLSSPKTGRSMCKAILAAAVAATLVLPATAAGTAVRLEIEGLVDRADLVFEARVLSARTYSTSDGRIETEYVAFVRGQPFWGEPAGTRTFRLPGGFLPDGSGLLLPGMPAVSAGDDAIFFLAAEGPTGLRMPVGLAQGKMDVFVDAQGYRGLSRSQSGLALLDPITGQVQEANPRALFDYQETVVRIRAAAQARRVREAREER